MTLPGGIMETLKILMDNLSPSIQVHVFLPELSFASW